jgi:aspartate/methionine/tyrosine aminotransferase
MVLDEHTLAGFAELAMRYDLWVVSDEVYAALRYDEAPPRSIASLPGMAGRTIVVDSFSKTYAMTGWRLGYGVMPAAVAGTVRALVAESTTCAAPFVQHAGMAALQGPQDAVARMRAEYRVRRDEIVRALSAIPGIGASSPPGAFYAFANVSGLAGGTSAELAERLLREHGVASMPGSAYGQRGEGYLRLSFASPIGELREAARRVAAFAAAMRPGPA